MENDNALNKQVGFCNVGNKQIQMEKRRLKSERKVDISMKFGSLSWGSGKGGVPFSPLASSSQVCKNH